MAFLLSEDEEIKTSFEIIFFKDKLETKHNVSWITYKLVLTSGENKLIYESPLGKKVGDYVLSLEPVNEINNLISGLKDFLDNNEKKIFSFEPLEPSFEIIIERSHKGFSTNIWVDAGNVISDHYTWDGFGLRFFTTEKNIFNFIDDLKKEFDFCNAKKN